MRLTIPSALGLAIGQSLFLTELHKSVLRYTDAVSPEQVIAVGATGLTLLTSSPEVLEVLRRAYSNSVIKALILALVAACLAFPPSLAMEFKNIKRIAEARAQDQQGPIKEAGDVERAPKGSE
jgi:hypothetical protein